MRITTGDKISDINLPSIDGSTFELKHIEGKAFMLCFFRFASCPFCNLRINELVKRFDELGQDFTIVAIFDSPIDNLTQHTQGHHAPFAILADENNQYYQKFGIERSIVGVFKGMILRFPTLLKALFKGYLPLAFKGNVTTMPADFLIDKQGIVQLTYYAKDEGDHLDFATIQEFSQQK